MHYHATVVLARLDFIACYVCCFCIFSQFMHVHFFANFFCKCTTERGRKHTVFLRVVPTCDAYTRDRGLKCWAHKKKKYEFLKKLFQPAAKVVIPQIALIAHRHHLETKQGKAAPPPVRPGICPQQRPQSRLFCV